MSKLSMPAELYSELLAALTWSGVEHVAFLFSEPSKPLAPLRVQEIYRVPKSGFDFQSDVHVSLTDETRAYVIKRAWELGGSLIEAHSHKHGPAGFSRSDLFGFSDWVPHVRWRLRGRTYIALVSAGSEFDALVWEGPGNEATPLQALSVDGQQPIVPTGNTYRQLSRRQK